jgi:hypothetical protein
MPTHRRTWQKREQAAAALFLALRQPGSGSSGRPDETRSDSRHPRFFIECKAYARHAVRTLHDKTRVLALREKKLPVLCLSDKNRPGFLVAIHSSDLDAFVAEYVAMHAVRMEPLIRQAHMRQAGVPEGQEWDDSTPITEEAL